MEPNQQKIVKLLSALIAASAIVVMAVLAVALNEEQTGRDWDRDRGDGGGWWHAMAHSTEGSDTGCPADHEGRRTQGLPLTRPRTAPSGSVGVGVDSRRSSADPLPAYLLTKRTGLFTSRPQVQVDGLGLPWNGQTGGFAMPGPPPKPASKRRRANTPKSYGAAEPTTAPAAHIQDRELGIDDPHPLIVDMWTTVQESCEARFYSEADWERLRFELWYANRAMTQPPADLRAHLGRHPARPDRAADRPGRQAPRRDRTAAAGPGYRCRSGGVDDREVPAVA